MYYQFYMGSHGGLSIFALKFANEFTNAFFTKFYLVWYFYYQKFALSYENKNKHDKKFIKKININ